MADGPSGFAGRPGGGTLPPGNLEPRKKLLANCLKRPFFHFRRHRGSITMELFTQLESLIAENRDMKARLQALEAPKKYTKLVVSVMGSIRRGVRYDTV